MADEGGWGRLCGLRLLIPVFLSCFQTLVEVLIMKMHINWAILNCGLSDSINLRHCVLSAAKLHSSVLSHLSLKQ